jgi:hypothetical protein
MYGMPNCNVVYKKGNVWEFYTASIVLIVTHWEWVLIAWVDIIFQNGVCIWFPTRFKGDTLFPVYIIRWWYFIASPIKWLALCLGIRIEI